MARRAKAKEKQKDRKNTDKEQSERFMETARKLGIADGDAFDRATRALLPPKKRKD